MNYPRIIAMSVLLLSTLSLAAPATEPGATTRAATRPAHEDPSLPNVLIIGDSISVGYTDIVRQLLAGKANVYRAPGNSGPSSSGVQHADAWLASAKNHRPWDVIHFNFGLHDVKITPGGKDKTPYPGGHQVSPEDYESNLRQIVAHFKAAGATVVFGTTTPVPEGHLDPLRKPGDEITYNAIAKKIMDENQVAIDDLNAAVLPQIAQLQRKENVHFTDEGYAVLAKQVAASIESALATRTPPKKD